jgi:hypothetical protein
MTESEALFARSFVTLRRLLSSREPDVNTLAKSLSETCAAAHESLSESIKLSLLRATTAEAREAGQFSFGDLIRTSCTLRICHSSLLQAVERLFVKAGSEHCGVYAIVLLFERILGHLHEIAVIKSGTTIEAGDSVEPEERRTIKQRPLPTLTLDEGCHALTKLVIQFFKVLDLSKLPHNRVFDSLICIFLDHLGSSLSLVVFADVDATSSTAAELGFLPPCGLLDTSHVDQQTATRTAQYEARYLVTILRHLMNCIDKRQSLRKSVSDPLLTLDKPLTNSNSAFAVGVRNKLQKTLLRGMFGDDDESFRDALPRPVVNAIDDDVDVARSGQEDPGEWFVGEVWRLLGWSVLTGHNGDL